MFFSKNFKNPYFSLENFQSPIFFSKKISDPHNRSSNRVPRSKKDQPLRCCFIICKTRKITHFVSIFGHIPGNVQKKNHVVNQKVSFSSYLATVKILSIFHFLVKRLKSMKLPKLWNWEKRTFVFFSGQSCEWLHAS